jgi:hypothetical protein
MKQKIRKRMVAASLDEAEYWRMPETAKKLRWSVAQVLREVIVRGLPSMRRDMSSTRLPTVGRERQQELR